MVELRYISWNYGVVRKHDVVSTMILHNHYSRQICMYCPLPTGKWHTQDTKIHLSSQTTLKARHIHVFLVGRLAMSRSLISCNTAMISCNTAMIADDVVGISKKLPKSISLPYNTD